MSPNIARTGKVRLAPLFRNGRVQVPKWGVILMPYDTPFLIGIDFCQHLARLQCDFLNQTYPDKRYKVVRLTGTVSYTVAK